jgi:glyoxylase-like metal-dependent hydrolase (beta-lactamase superfamily II)
LDDSIVIDTGFGWARNALSATLKELALDRTIKFVINTHYHEDHVGNNDLFAQLTKAPILAHRDAIAEIRFPYEHAWYRRFLFGPSETVEIQDLSAKICTAQTVLEVIETPGHCPGHVCLFEPTRRWLFSGDLFISAKLDSQLADADGPLWIESLDRVIALQPECMFDGHGTILIGADIVLEQLGNKRQFLLALQQRITECASQAQSVQEITRKVFQSHACADSLSLHEGWLSLLTASDFSRSNLVRSFLREITSAQFR